ncbi:MAG: hypothetical protein U5K43_04180 [Halofilum sp. (in: g-proteobacteria)]|nr:hypothetical protein [Halofilum sp. (in: g-proteobacteria)]
MKWYIAWAGRQLADRRQHAERVAGQEDDVVGHARRARDARIRDVVDRVGAARVRGDGVVVEVDHARLGIVDDVLEHGAEADGVVDLRLGLGREVDRLGVAAALDVEDAVVRPAVLVVADERTMRVGRQRGLAGPRQAEEHGHVTGGACRWPSSASTARRAAA